MIRRRRSGSVRTSAAAAFAAAATLALPCALRADLVALATSIDAPKVAAAAAAEPIRFGRATITPAAGARVWILAAGDRPCALWLDGGGRLEYRIDDPAVQPVARKNLEGSTSLRFDDAAGSLTIREELRGALVWGWELAAGARRTGEASGAPPFPAWAADVLVRRLFWPPSVALIEADGNGARGVVWALLDGEKEQLVATVDPRPAAATEQLIATWKLPPLYRDYAGRLVPLMIAELPIGRAFATIPPPELVARHYDIEITQTSKTGARIRTEVELEAARAGLSHWLAVLDGERRADGRDYPVRVVSAKVDGQPAEHIFTEDALLVALGKALPAGGRTKVEIVAEGEYALRPDRDSYWMLGFEAWQPRPPEMRDVMADFSITVDVPGPWIPYASGKTESRQTKDGRNRLVSHLAGPMRAPLVSVGSYSEVSEVVDGVRVIVASYAFDKPDEAKRLIHNFGVLKQCLEKLFGVPYPFEELDIVEANDWGFGQAPAGVIRVTREAFTKAGMVQAMGETSVGVNQLITHEVAHAYWAHVVKYDTGREQWLSESFADYTTALCLQMAAEDERKGKREFEKMVNEWRGQAAKIRKGVTIATANQLAFKEDGDTYDRYFTLYARGPLVLQAIREELGRMLGGAEKGDKSFAAFMRAIVKNFTYRSPSTQDLVGILEQITKQPWQPFFDRYVYGAETPKVN